MRGYCATCRGEITIPEDPEGKAKVTVDLSALLPSNLSYYTYKGSLTSPTCNETLLWHVMATPMYLPRELIDKVTNAVYDANENSLFDFRETQPLNGRSVFYYDDALDACSSSSAEATSEDTGSTA